MFCVVLCRSLFVFSEVCVAQCLVFCVVLCRSLFVFSVVCVAQCLVLCRSLKVNLLFVLFVYILLKWSVIVIILNTCLNSMSA